MELSRELVASILRYDPETGELHWIVGGKGRIRSRPAGTARKQDGAIYIKINGRQYAAHRLAWLLHYGEWPSNHIDHKNLNAGDNRIENLREATNSQNGANKKARCKSGLKGAYKAGRGGWYSSITVGGKLVYLGMFDTPEEAHTAYVSAAKREFGEFARA